MNGKTDRRLLRAIGYAALVLLLPLALLGALHGPNEYRDVFGMDALDCDGPLQTYILALPPLVFYAAASLFAAHRWRRWRQWRNLTIAALCFLICAALIANIARAALHERKQAQACPQR